MEKLVIQNGCQTEMRLQNKRYGNRKTWGEILDKNGIDGIEFKDGEPDFTPVSKGTVEIDDFTIIEMIIFYQADIS